MAAHKRSQSNEIPIGIWRTAAAICFLTLLGAGTARADTGYVYAYVADGSTPTISPAYSLSPYGPITVQHISTGRYTVTFTGSGIGPNWAVLASAAGGTPGVYCNTSSWDGSAGIVDCFGPGGTPVDSPFRVVAIASTNDKNIAFAWSGQIGSGTYNTPISYTYNPSGTVSITHSATGIFQVTFNGLSGSGGSVQVVGYGTSALCNSNGWTLPTVNVQCSDPSGNPVDSVFVVAVVPPGSTPAGLAFTYGNSPSSASYTPAGATSYNPTGYPVNIARQSLGNYSVTFYGLSSVPVTGGNVMITSDGSTARCIATGWAPGANSSLAFVVSVACSDPFGNPVDTAFEAFALPPMGFAYASISNGSTAAVSLLNSVNPGGAAVTAAHNGAGSYTVTFPNSGIGPGWVAYAFGIRGSTNWCHVQSWASSSVAVVCFTPDGTPVDTPFQLLAISTTNGESMASAWANQPSTASYNPPRDYSYNPAGIITISQISTGYYSVIFEGLNANGGTVQISSTGAGTGTCFSQGWGGGFNATVECDDPSGNPADTPFVITVISASDTPANLSYAWADQATSASYTPFATYSYPPGTVTVNRLDTGLYQAVTPFSPGGGYNQVTAYTTAARCLSTVGVEVVLQCSDLTGAPVDTRFEFLQLASIPGIPFSTFPSVTPQSTGVTTAFTSPLTVFVRDVTGHARAGLFVTFTAPASGPSGTFPGGATSVTVATDNTGTATAPTFRANNISGTFTLTASIASYPFGVSPASFTLTNTGLPSVTLQTSPAGLAVSLGDNNTTAPYTITLPPGTVETIATQSPQAGSTGTQYVWQNWSDGLAISHDITVPSSTTTYTANFKAQYLLTAGASPASEGSASPVAASYYDSGAVAPVVASPSNGYLFTGWTGPVADPSNPSTTVTMNGPATVIAHFAPSCDINGDSHMTVADVQQIINQAMGVSTVHADMNADGGLNIVDVQIVLNAASGGSCSAV